MSRRAWLRRAAGSAAGFGIAVAGRWQPRGGAAAEPDGFLDTHTHFYDPARPEGVPWPPKGDPVLYRTVLPPEYQALEKPHPVEGTVVVEASAWLEDNQWVLDLAQAHPFIVGFVGNLTPGDGSCAEHLDRFSKNPKFSGIRVWPRVFVDGWETGAVLDDLKTVERLGLGIDVNVSGAALENVARLAAALPRLRIVINHLANVRIDGRAPHAEWVRRMELAGAHLNVFCKLSGLVEGTGRTDGTAPVELDFYRPVLDAAWGIFGAGRMIYGSNWPVSARFAPLHRVQQLAMDYVSEKGPGALRKVFAENGRRFYQTSGSELRQETSSP